MAELTKEQRIFLNHHNIPEELTFNASGLPKSIYHSKMKEQGKIIAYNVTPCGAGRHTLRTRNGHCIQCDTSKIAFIKRAISLGIIYIAGTITGQLIKIGYTQNKSIREESLNRTKYGGFEDWQILYSAQSLSAAKIESLSQSSLTRYGISNKYEHDGHLQETYELFRCSYSKSKEAIDTVLANNSFNISSVVENKLKLSKYSFRNLIRSK